MTLFFVPDDFRASLDSASDPIVLVDEAGRIAFLNARAEKLFGYGQTELVGCPVEALIPEGVCVERPAATGFPARADQRFVLVTVADIAAHTGGRSPPRTRDGQSGGDCRSRSRTSTGER